MNEVAAGGNLQDEQNVITSIRFKDGDQGRETEIAQQI
jgi:hypothetical protein